MPSYSTLVRSHHALVFRVALGVLRDRAAAEDVTQDVFLSFLVDPGPLERASSLRAFVGRVALNRALDARKASQRRAVRESAFAERGGQMNPVEEAFRRELRDKVHELPEIHRAAVDLHYFQGLTIAETAEILSVPRGTASRRISDAIATLRKWLSAAAFVALLAKLESELSKVEAAEVPAGLETRLLRLRPPAAARGLKGKTAKASVALAVALLFAVYTGQWIETHDPRWSGGAPASVPIVASVAAETPESADAPADATTDSADVAFPPVVNLEPVAALAQTETVLEGFLFRTPEGLCLAEEIVPGPGDGGHTGMLRPAGRVWLLAGGGLDSWPAADTANFTPFLCDGAPSSSAPRARVRLRARIPQEAPAEPQLAAGQNQAAWTGKIEFKADDITLNGAFKLEMTEEVQVVPAQVDFGFPGTKTSDGFELVWNDAKLALNGADQLLDDGSQWTTWSVRQEDPLPVTATVLEVLDVELLSDAWLEAWRDMFTESSAILANMSGSPEELAASAARLGDAIRRARLARAGQSPTTWRVRMEQKFSADAVARLGDLGFGSFLPGVPTELQLREVFLSAKSQAEFRAAIESRWGPEGLDLALNVVRCIRDYEVEIASDGIADPVGGSPVSVLELSQMKDNEFFSTQGATRDSFAPKPQEIRLDEEALEMKLGVEAPSR